MSNPGAATTTTTSYGMGPGSPALIGGSATDLVGFYGATPVARPASASQAAVTITAVTTLLTTALKGTTTKNFGYATSTQAKAIELRVNQVLADLASIKVLVNKLRADQVTIGLIKGAA